MELWSNQGENLETFVLAIPLKQEENDVESIIRQNLGDIIPVKLAADASWELLDFDMMVAVDEGIFTFFPMRYLGPLSISGY